MRPLPFYLRIMPMYYGCSHRYNRYLWFIYSGIYNATNDEQPLQQAKSLLPHFKSNYDETILLQTAFKAGKLAEILTNQQPQLISDIAFRLKMAEGIIGGLALILYAILVAVPIFAMYMPIFMLGDVLS